MLDEVVADLGPGVTLVGHSLGAAAVLAATPSPSVDGIVLVDPAGFTKPALGFGVLAAFLAWMLRPGTSSSARLVGHLQAPSHLPSDELVGWFTVVGRSCRSAGAPGPSDPEVVARWQDTPRAVVVGEHDVFFPPGRLTPVVEDRLDVTPVVVPASGHLLPEEDPRAVVDAVLALPDG
jgi:pimeloyl-ACP methyl ester carboxylesterase